MSLFNRVRGAISGNQAEVDPHDWRLPSSYSTPSKPAAGNQATVIPHPKIFANAFIPQELKAARSEASLSYPDISHAAVHLALLECFQNLRLGATALDVTLPQPLPAYEEKHRPGTSTAATAAPVESQKWDLLLRLAVTRFTAWWTNIDHVLNHAAAYAHHAGDKVAVQLTKDYLPPLDVLLVWYALMLDADAYGAACSGHERHVPGLQALCFPWPAIRDAVNMETLQFELPRPAANLFSTLSGQSADIMTYLAGPPAYTETHELPLAIDLFAEVKKNEEFITAAHDLLWIRAPALKGSLERASVEYLDFQFGQKAVDETDGDVSFGAHLIWRTHRLFPTQYQLFCQSNEDEALRRGSKSPTLTINSQGGGSSSDWGVAGLGQAFELCRCWTCERIRDEIPTFIHTPPSSTSGGASPSLMRNLLASLSSEQLRQIKDDLGFYHAVESARRRFAPLPTRPRTPAEKEADRIAKEKQKEVGYLPGLHEYVEILPDGRRKIRRQKYASPWGKLPWAATA